MTEAELLKTLCACFAADLSLQEDLHVYERESKPEDRMPYMVAGSIGAAAIDAFRADRPLDAFTRCLESLYPTASRSQAELLTVGVLESIQNRLSSDRPRYAAFATQLGPIARSEWNKLDSFWSGGKNGGEGGT